MTVPYMLIGVCLLILFYYVSRTDIPSETCLQIIDAYRPVASENSIPVVTASAVAGGTSTHSGTINARTVEPRVAVGAVPGW